MSCITSERDGSVPVVMLNRVPISQILRVNHRVVREPFDRAFPRVDKCGCPSLQLRQNILAIRWGDTAPVHEELELPGRWVVDVVDTLRYVGVSVW